MGNFFNILFLVSFTFSLTAQKIYVQNSNTGKMVQIDKSRPVIYSLKSDSILLSDTISFELSEYEGQIFKLTDTTFILSNGAQVRFDDLIYIEQLSIRNFKLRRWLVTPLVAGSGFFLRGLIMLTGEGLSSKNSTLVPLNLIGGAAIAGASVYPFLKKPKRFYMRKGWELVSVNN